MWCVFVQSTDNHKDFPLKRPAERVTLIHLQRKTKDQDRAIVFSFVYIEISYNCAFASKGFPSAHLDFNHTDQKEKTY